MKTQKEIHIIITGFGGQGIVLAGDILGKAASIYDHKFATMTQNYGPEARGGACSSQVIISHEEILFPCVENPEILVCMSQEAYTKNIKSLRPGGTLIWDTDLVHTRKTDINCKTYNIPATRFAEELGTKMMANIVMLGFLSAVEHLVHADALKKAILDSVPPSTKDNNLNAFNTGREYGHSVIKDLPKPEHVGD
ncbi:MAG TPA: 2-oxoacid:acceptor oxidoreductase family protein [Smithella sp.]|nr:2-oxoacid:acceptor oxidoreductase family protein [Smithella sp.]HNY49040.1 2-oxoacid:acceptor oxidoreductase family protein [Smithella sp.]HOG89993.1 2-oxoacid:acceptor oxidoreductase family protein [Smithella sp.]HOU50537.1 2-oxoacid:acceptor oxidoreductase family protein [Smithella sp.]HQG65370.1 2-oxoacid:acceptor oxidoreductase family protein [Smithella sp.]